MRPPPAPRVRGFLAEADVTVRVLDALDMCVAVFDASLERILFANVLARRVFGSDIPESVVELARDYISTRRDLVRAPPAIRFEHEQRVFYLRVVESAGDGPLEILFIREEVVRDPELFRMLNARYSVSHREFQVLNLVRAGNTNKRIGAMLKIAESTVAAHVGMLLERFSVPNRTALVKIVETLAGRRG